MTSTNTYTKTYARLALVQTNVRAALRALGWPKSLIDKLVDIGLAAENRYVREFHTYGFAPGTTRWQLHSWIGVDWDEHNRLVVTNSMVTVDNRWVNGENPGLIEQADGFGRLIGEFGLTPEYAWAYSRSLAADSVKKAAAKEHMGLTSTKSLECEPDGAIEDSQSNKLAGLTEVTYGTESAFPE